MPELGYTESPTTILQLNASEAQCNSTFGSAFSCFQCTLRTQIYNSSAPYDYYDISIYNDVAEANVCSGPYVEFSVMSPNGNVLPSHPSASSINMYSFNIGNSYKNIPCNNSIVNGLSMTQRPDSCWAFWNLMVACRQDSPCPTQSPTTAVPSQSPTLSPSQAPSTFYPSQSPTSFRPSTSPLSTPPTISPSSSPSSSRPSASPSSAPSSAVPSNAPTSTRPSRSPSSSPTLATPSHSPTSQRPSNAPTRSPSSRSPTASPTSTVPTRAPVSQTPTAAPSRAPSQSPITNRPSAAPSSSPSKSPSEAPTLSPLTSAPSQSPLRTPTSAPLRAPTVSPTRPGETWRPSTAPYSHAPTASPEWTQPRLLSAQFTDDATAIIVIFDRPTNMRGTTGAFQSCFPWLYVQETCPGAQMDCGHVCSFLDPNTLQVSLKATTDVKINANVTINASISALLNGGGPSPPAGGIVSAQIMKHPPKPSVDIIGPQRASLCGNDTALQANIIGTGGRSLKSLQWFLAGQPILLANNQSLVVRKPTVPTNMTFTINATNWLGRSALSSPFTVEFNNDSNFDLLVSMPSFFKSSAAVSLQPQALISIGCPIANASLQTYYWQIVNDQNVDVTAQTNALGLNSPVLVTVPGALLPGHTYRFVSIVQVGGDGSRRQLSTSQSASASFAVAVVAAPLVPIISGAGVRTVNQGQTSFLDASASCDPNLYSPRCTTLGQIDQPLDTSMLTFQWTCWFSNGTQCPPLVNSTEPVLPLVNLEAMYAPYLFSVTLSARSLNYSSPSNVTTSSVVTVYVNPLVPGCELAQVLMNSFPARLNVDPFSNIAIAASVTPVNASIFWEQLVSRQLYSAQALVGAQGTVSRPNLILLGSQLSAGAKYTFQVTASVSCAPYLSYAQISFSTNHPPSGGQLAVSPSTGYMALTSFTLTSSTFEDAEGDYPLAYSFEFYDGTLLAPLSDWTASPQLTTSLPGPEIILYARAKDSFGGVSGYSVFLTLNLSVPAFGSFNVSDQLAWLVSQGGSPQSLFNAALSMSMAASYGYGATSSNSTEGDQASLVNVQNDLLGFLNSSAAALSSSDTATPRQAVQQFGLLLQLSIGATLLGGQSSDFLSQTTGLGSSLLGNTKALIQASILGNSDPSASATVPSTLGSTFLSWTTQTLGALSGLVRGGNTVLARRRVDNSSSLDSSLQHQAILEAQRGNIRALISTLLVAAIEGAPPLNLPGIDLKVVAVRESTNLVGQPQGTSEIIVPAFDENQPPAIFYLPSDVLDNTSASHVNVFAVRFRFNIDELVAASQPNTTLDPRAPANGSTVKEVLELGFATTDGSGFFHPANLSIPIGIKMPLAFQDLPALAINGTLNLSCGYWDDLSAQWSSQGCLNVTKFQAPNSSNDLSGWLLCECNHASDYAAWKKFVSDLEHQFDAIDYSHLSVILVTFVACFVPVVFVLWLIVYAIQRRLDMRDASLVHLGAFVLITRNKIQMHRRARMFLAAMLKNLNDESSQMSVRQLAARRLALPRKAGPPPVPWYQFFADVKQGLKYDHGMMNMFARFDPYFGRTQRWGVFLAMFLGNLFVNCFFFEFKSGGDDVSVGFIIGTTILASFAVAIPVKMTIKVLFRTTAAAQGSDLDRVLHIFRISSEADNIAPVAMSDLERADLALLAAMRKFYTAQYRYNLLNSALKKQARSDEDRARIAAGRAPRGSFEVLMLRCIQISGVLNCAVAALDITILIIDARGFPLSSSEVGLGVACIILGLAVPSMIALVLFNRRFAPAFMRVYAALQMVLLGLSAAAAVLIPNKFTSPGSQQQYQHVVSSASMAPTASPTTSDQVLQAEFADVAKASAAAACSFVALVLALGSTYVFFEIEPAIEGIAILPRRRPAFALRSVTEEADTRKQELPIVANPNMPQEQQFVRESRSSASPSVSRPLAHSARSLALSIGNSRPLRALALNTGNDNSDRWLSRQSRASGREVRQSGDWTLEVDSETGHMDPKTATRASFAMLATHGLLRALMSASPDGRIDSKFVDLAKAEMDDSMKSLLETQEYCAQALLSAPWPKRGVSKKRKAVKKENNPCLRVLRLLADRAGKKPEPVPKKLPWYYLYVAWTVLFAYYFFAIGWVCEWVFQRDNATQRNLQDQWYSNPNHTNGSFVVNHTLISIDSTSLMSAWIAASFVGVCIGYFAADPAVIIFKFGVLPLIIRQCERKQTEEQVEQERVEAMEDAMREAAKEPEEAQAKLKAPGGKPSGKNEAAKETGKDAAADLLDLSIDVVESFT